MEKGVLKYGEDDGMDGETRTVRRDRESQTRVIETRRKAEKNQVSTSSSPVAL